jgi:hypothetical protein
MYCYKIISKCEQNPKVMPNLKYYRGRINDNIFNCNFYGKKKYKTFEINVYMFALLLNKTFTRKLLYFFMIFLTPLL